MTSSVKTGDLFGMLTVVRRTRPNYALCRCACGRDCEVCTGKLVAGWTKSCGCLQKQRAKATAEKHNRAKRQSMIGRTFGRLTVTGIDHWKPATRIGDGRRYYYKVRCTCGIEKTVLGQNLVKGGTKSCGCLRREGHPGRNKLPKGEAAFRRCLAVYKHKSLKQNLPFSLSIDAFRKLTGSSCYYCGVSPSNESKHPSGNGSFTYSGIDRVDNNLGYTTENTVPCCRRCNIAKNDQSQQEFMLWIRRVAAHYRTSARSGG